MISIALGLAKTSHAGAAAITSMAGYVRLK
jgi:hypothetical protein